MSRLPEQICVKRKATDDPVESLLLQNERNQKRYLSNVAYRRLKKGQNGLFQTPMPPAPVRAPPSLRTVWPAKAAPPPDASSTSGPSDKISNLAPAPTLPSISTNQNQDLGQRVPPAEQKDSGRVVGNGSGPSQSGRRPRLFQLSLSHTRTRALSDKGAISGRKHHQGTSGIATFVERETKKDRLGPDTPDNSSKYASSRTQGQKYPRESPAQEENGRELSSLSHASSPSKPHRRLPESSPIKFAPNTTGMARLGPKTMVGDSAQPTGILSEPMLIDSPDASATEIGTDSFVYDVYVMETDQTSDLPSGSNDNNVMSNTSDDTADNVGLIIINDADEDILISFADDESEHDEEFDSEDENAEGYYAHDYPNDPWESDGERDSGEEDDYIVDDDDDGWGDDVYYPDDHYQGFH
ncbi:MAG: hypothetical protein M1814_002056 [Vezdaea aestivalis]|nr:MAG: hypothetical protein M1814_002056 [Vezdaea aestivalis]